MIIAPRVHMAKRAVPIIRNFWRKHYNGKWYRRRSGDIDAYEIAAAYFAVERRSCETKTPRPAQETGR